MTGSNQHDGVRMARAINDLDKGNALSVADLRWLILEANRTISTFALVPAYRLFVSDLVRLRNSAELYLHNQASVA